MHKQNQMRIKITIKIIMLMIILILIIKIKMIILIIRKSLYKYLPTVALHSTSELQIKFQSSH